MSMLERYNRLTTLRGFSLGFFTFFKNFRYSHNPRYRGITWREIPLVAGPKAFEIEEYVIEQMKWIEDFKTQELLSHKSKQVYFDCKKRLTFFMEELESLSRQRSAILSDSFYRSLTDIRTESSNCIRCSDVITIPSQSFMERRREYKSGSYRGDSFYIPVSSYTGRDRSRSRERVSPPLPPSEPRYFFDKTGIYNPEVEKIIRDSMETSSTIKE